MAKLGLLFIQHSLDGLPDNPGDRHTIPPRNFCNTRVLVVTEADRKTVRGLVGCFRQARQRHSSPRISASPLYTRVVQRLNAADIIPKVIFYNVINSMSGLFTHSVLGIHPTFMVIAPPATLAATASYEPTLARRLLTNVRNGGRYAAADCFSGFSTAVSVENCAR